MTDNSSKVDPFAALDDMDDFQPKSPRQIIVPEKHQLDSLANTHGFTTRNFGPNTETKQYLRKPGEQTEPTINTSMRVFMSDWNKFTEWCKHNRYTAKIAFHILTEKIDEFNARDQA
jgi:hypothetical protein